MTNFEPSKKPLEAASSYSPLLVSVMREFEQLPNKLDGSALRVEIPRLARMLAGDPQLPALLGLRSLGALLGSGSNSIVLAGEKEDGSRMAVKFSKPFQIQVERSENQLFFDREADVLGILRRAQVPYVVQLVDTRMIAESEAGMRVGVLIEEQVPGTSASVVCKKFVEKGKPIDFYREVYGCLLGLAYRGAQLGVAFHDLDAHNAVIELNGKQILKSFRVVDFAEVRTGIATPAEALQETLERSLKPGLCAPKVVAAQGRFVDHETVGFISDILADFQDGILNLQQAQHMLQTGEYV